MKREIKILKTVESYLVVINAVALTALLGIWIGYELGRYLT